MNILVVIEDSRGSMHRMSKEAIAGAQKIGGNIIALVIGDNADALSNELSSIDIEKTLIVKMLQKKLSHQKKLLIRFIHIIRQQN